MNKRVALRTAAVFVIALASALAQALPGFPDPGEIYAAGLTAVIATGAYLGVGAATPLEPSFGKKV